MESADNWHEKNKQIIIIPEVEKRDFLKRNSLSAH